MSLTKPFLTLGVILLAGACSAAITTKNLRCEYLVNPLGIDAPSPRLSWILTSAQRGESETAYQIVVASSKKLLDADTGDLWDSGKVVSNESSQIAYGGQPLTSREKCFWKVKVWDHDGKPSAWSAVADWQMGLLQPGDWSAKWIGPGVPPPDTNTTLVIHHATYEAVADTGTADVTAALTSHITNGRLKIDVNNKTLGVDPALNVVKRLRVEYEYGGKTLEKDIDENETLVLPERPTPLPCFRKTFALNSPVKRAMLYVTALGLYELDINGQRVGDHILAPDWTDYRKRIRYQAYDVTALLKPGENAIGALLANGWFAGHIGNGGYQFFGKDPSFVAQLEITGADGTSQEIPTDASWKSHDSPILSSDFMLGEDYDARLETAGWASAGLDEQGWLPVTLRDTPAVPLESQTMEPVRQLVLLKPKAINQTGPGTWVYDLGQNMVGVVRLKISDPAGTKVTLRHAEMLNSDGTIYTKNLRRAPSIDHYICKGGGVELWQPRFTFHGFRYVEVSGLSNRPAGDAVTGVVIGTDNPQTGEFSCSDPRINQLQSNIQWGQRGNYISVPTDCPQRDERLGWMGDAQVFVRTATYNADVAAFFTKWLVDVDDGQSASGSFSDVSPNTMGANGVPAWGDAGVICPWTIYEVYGDKRILERHLPAMTKWVDYLQAHSVDLIRENDRGNDYGDWLSIGADTPKDLIGTAYFAYSTHLLAKSYAALGLPDQAAKYDELFEKIKAAFDKKFVSADGHIAGNTQCSYLLALKFELLPEALRSQVAQYLEDDVKAKDWHLSTGFVGVSYLLPVLSQAGKTETAYKLLQQDTFPSWLFSVKHGATTIWERWDGWTPEKGFQDPGMNSFNHYSLGSCGEYLFGGIGGIRPASAGYKTILIKPTVADGLTWAKTSYDSINGKIATAWRKDGNQLTLKVTVPVNTSATVYVPASNVSQITESGHPAAQASGLQFLREENGCGVFTVNSGTYDFAAPIGG